MNVNIAKEDKKVRVELIPLKGIQIETDHTIIQFGHSKKVVKGILGNPSTEYENKLYHHDLEIRIDFDEKGCVEFIEVLSGPYCERIEPLIYGRNPFKIVDTQLIEFLEKMNNGKIDDHEAVYGYSFLNISVGIWRDLTSESVEEMIHYAKETGEYDSLKEELEADFERAKYFRTIGIGVKGYYDK